MGFGNSNASVMSTGTGPQGMSSFGNIMGAGGAATSGIGAYYSAQAQKSALEYKAVVADTNARLAEKTAQSVLQQGQQQANQVQLKTGQLEGAQRAGLAANGVDLGEGSAARILATTDMMGKLDADTTIANAVRTAWGYRAQATNQTNDAAVSRASAGAVSPLASGMGSLLTGASGVAKNWYAQKKVGA